VKKSEKKREKEKKRDKKEQSRIFCQLWRKRR
jgi:hypothetical protein